MIFKAKTREGFALKVLAELLQNNFKTACFEIGQEGIKLRMMDHHRIILIDLFLDADNFSVYKYKLSEKMTIGLNLIHLHKMLKLVKKRDSVRLFISDTASTDLGIKIIPKENSRVTTSFVKIQNAQAIDIDVPEGYGKPVIVASSDFQKMCKGLNISAMTRIIKKGFLVRFFNDVGDVMKRYTDLGETEDSDTDDEADDTDEDEVEYSEDFDTEQLTKITKLSGLSPTMQIYPKNCDSLLIKTAIGSLGRISVYIKPKSQQESDARTEEDEDN
jgi:proliferating cell nuclear antigen PCNA